MRMKETKCLKQDKIYFLPPLGYRCMDAYASRYNECKRDKSIFLSSLLWLWRKLLRSLRLTALHACSLHSICHGNIRERKRQTIFQFLSYWYVTMVTCIRTGCMQRYECIFTRSKVTYYTLVSFAPIMAQRRTQPRRTVTSAFLRGVRQKIIREKKSNISMCLFHSHYFLLYAA